MRVTGKILRAIRETSPDYRETDDDFRETGLPRYNQVGQSTLSSERLAPNLELRETGQRALQVEDEVAFINTILPW